MSHTSAQVGSAERSRRGPGLVKPVVILAALAFAALAALHEGQVQRLAAVRKAD